MERRVNGSIMHDAYTNIQASLIELYRDMGLGLVGVQLGQGEPVSDILSCIKP